MTANWKNPRQRASNSERESAVATIDNALADGRITPTEHQERLDQATGAVFLDELESLTADIGGMGGLLRYPQPGSAPTGELSDTFRADEDALPAPRPQSAPVRYAPEGASGDSFSISVLGASSLTGQWIVAKRHTSLAVMGGTEIDLRDALLTSNQVTITCIAVMGGIDIIVPDNAIIRVNGIGLLGGFGWEKSTSALPETLPSDAPTITINGIGLMGGVDILRRSR